MRTSRSQLLKVGQCRRGERLDRRRGRGRGMGRESRGPPPMRRRIIPIAIAEPPVHKNRTQVAQIAEVPPVTTWSTMTTNSVMAATINPPARTRRPICCSSLLWNIARTVPQPNAAVYRELPPSRTAASESCALYAKRAGGACLETSQWDLATTSFTYPVGAGLDLGQRRIDALDRGEDRTGSGGAGDPFHRFGGAISDPFPERHGGPGFRWLHETIQLRAQGLPASAE